MTLEIKPNARAGAVAVAFVLPDCVPTVTLADVEAATRRSRGAHRLCQELESHRRAGHACTRREVRELLQRALAKDGKPDGSQAVVMAYYAQKHAEVFAPEARKSISDFLGKLDWPALMADLRAFIDDLRRKEAEHKKAEQIKKDRETDALKHEEKKRDLIKANGTADERKRELARQNAQKAEEKERLREVSPGDLSEELTSSGRLPLSDLEKAHLQLIKKGFANRD